jgi:hypothetical protein
MNKSLKQVLLSYSVLFGVIYAPLVLWLSARSRSASVLAPIQFFTSDTFYYLSIARHSITSSFYTSDGLYPTNGFHPLWGFLLTKLFSLPAFASQLDLQIFLTFGLSLALTALGMMFFGLVVYHLTENASVSLLASVPGFYYLIFAPLIPNYNSTWAYINGMESPLSIFWFGLLLYMLVNKNLLPDQRWWATAVLSILMTLVIFSRLDDVFLLLPFWALLFLFSNSRKQAFGRLAIAMGIPLVALLAYMMFNYSYTGSAMPVSGLIKNGNWLSVNLIFFITSFFPIQLAQYNPIWSEASMRSLQTVIPALAAVLWIFIWGKNQNWKAIPRDTNTIISALAVYVVIKGVYNLVLVYLMGQGHWYYSISIMVFNLIVAVVVAGLLKGITSQRQRTLLAVASLSLVILLGNTFIYNKIHSEYNLGYYKFWLQKDSVNEALTALDPDLKVVEYDDGILSYLLDAPAMNGFGFTLDKEAAQMQTDGRLLELAYQRGYRTIAVMSYITFPDDLANDSDQIRERLQAMPGIKLENLDQWQFQFLYRDEESSSAFISFEPLTGK